MNSLLPDSHAADYITAVLTLYLQLPETPWHIRSHDRTLVRQLYDRGISLPVIETALLLASLRRLLRPADLPQLAPIRSLAYFQPVIEELLAHPAPDNYLQYLRSKLQRMPNRKIARTNRTPADGQKNTFSDGR